MAYLGALVCVPTHQPKPAVNALLRGEVWEPQTHRWFRKSCIGGDAVHAGTYFGDMLHTLSRAADLVYAFEPVPENYACALRTRDAPANNISNVVLRNAALSDARGEAAMNGTGGQAKIVSGAATARRTITTVRGDDVVPFRERRVTCIQLDVEGHEARALAGLEETIRAHAPALLLETVDKTTHAWLIARNYTRRRSVHANTEWLHRDSPRRGARERRWPKPGRPSAPRRAAAAQRRRALANIESARARGAQSTQKLIEFESALSANRTRRLGRSELR